MKNWKEKLWDRFKNALGQSSIDNKNNSMYDLEDFIKQLLKQQKADIINSLKLKYIKLDGHYTNNCYERDKGWNQAVDDLNNKIKDL